MDDIAEVSSYVAALEHGVARLKGGFPLSNRLIREIHEKLLPRGRGSEKAMLTSFRPRRLRSRTAWRRSSDSFTTSAPRTRPW
jgi:hypothetical protein